MLGVARVGDFEFGSCPTGPSSADPSLSIASGAGTVFVNEKAIARTGDPYSGVHVHISLSDQMHDVECGQGSETVFAEEKAVFRIGDPTSCLSVQKDGSDNVFAGG